MPRVGYEPKIPVFEEAKTVHALDRAAIVIGHPRLYTMQSKAFGWSELSPNYFEFTKFGLVE
jgi:hypothetical protein